MGKAHTEKDDTKAGLFQILNNLDDLLFRDAADAVGKCFATGRGPERIQELVIVALLDLDELIRALGGIGVPAVNGSRSSAPCGP